ncbi:motility protein MotB [Helicobacter sp. MIT 11-5569]|uniref:OmpA/MotB family protein n=1 Tax=Helicobacter sp. MIT 11-5569 TaxID=1548151 RepID=UPI00051FF31C|nr:flagellar motor protein MotB [Helicobacter sp. MIT 11-5569]TLD83255.1 motility protein MotB [Helicobacter sp. MIT 11-5569]
MAKQKKCPACDCPQGVPLWLGTYGDMVTLILTFFILLLSMATFDTQRIAQAVGSLEGSLAVLEKGSQSQINPPAPIKATPIETEVEMDNVVNIFGSLITDYNEVNRISNGPSVELEEAERGVIIRIPEELLFASGSAELTNPSGIAFLKRLTLELLRMPKAVLVKAIGHTDNVPIRKGAIFEDNLELSVARGVNVADLIIKQGLEKNRILGGGEGEFSPIANNDIPALRAKNRRVDLYVYSIGEDLSGVIGDIAKPKP